jgi:hypothetical protein
VSSPPTPADKELPIIPIQNARMIIIKIRYANDKHFIILLRVKLFLHCVIFFVPSYCDVSNHNDNSRQRIAVRDGDIQRRHIRIIAPLVAILYC